MKYIILIGILIFSLFITGCDYKCKEGKYNGVYCEKEIQTETFNLCGNVYPYQMIRPVGFIEEPILFKKTSPNNIIYEEMMEIDTKIIKTNASNYRYEIDSWVIFNNEDRTNYICVEFNLTYRYIRFIYPSNSWLTNEVKSYGGEID